MKTKIQMKLWRWNSEIVCERARERFAVSCVLLEKSYVRKEEKETKSHRRFDVYTLVQHWKYQIHKKKERKKYCSHSHELRMCGNRRVESTWNPEESTISTFESFNVCTWTYTTARAVTGPTRHHQLSEYSYIYIYMCTGERSQYMEQNGDEKRATKSEEKKKTHEERHGINGEEYIIYIHI